MIYFSIDTELAKQIASKKEFVIKRVSLPSVFLAYPYMLI